MSPIGLTTVMLTEADGPGCLALSSAAGWNQTLADWLFHIRNGKSIGLKTADGKIVGTGVVLYTGSGVGWIAMILVEETWRRKGLGRFIVQTLVTESSFRTLALDATEFGRSLYEQLGFRRLENIVRYRLERGQAPVRQEFEPDDRTPYTFEGIAAELLNRSDVTPVRSGSAYGLVRTGVTALHVGPITAGLEKDAADLIQKVIAGSKGNILVDVPSRAGTFARRLEHCHFGASRTFTRMARNGSFFVPPGTFAIAGPEYG